jgi:hypothetical protein
LANGHKLSGRQSITLCRATPKQWADRLQRAPGTRQLLRAYAQPYRAFDLHAAGRFGSANLQP